MLPLAYPYASEIKVTLLQAVAKARSSQNGQNCTGIPHQPLGCCGVSATSQLNLAVSITKLQSSSLLQAFFHAYVSALSSRVRFCKEKESKLAQQSDASSMVSLNQLLLITSQPAPGDLGQ